MGSIAVGYNMPWLLKGRYAQNKLETTYPTIELTLLDLIRADLDDEQVVQFTPEHLSLISQTMRNYYIYDLFWPEVRHLAMILLENLDNPQ